MAYDPQPPAGETLAGLDERRAKPGGDWDWRRLLVSGTPKSGFRRVSGLFLWKWDEKSVYVSLGGGDPRRHAWRVADGTDPAVLVHGVRGSRIEGVVLSGAFAAIRIAGAAEACTVRGCRVESFEKTGIAITEGSSACVIEGNSITRGAFESWAVRETEDNLRREEYEVWQVHKLAGFYDRVGIEVFRAGGRNRLLNNGIRETFDGINVGDHAGLVGRQQSDRT